MVGVKTRLAIIVLALASGPAAANEGLDLALKSKSMAAASAKAVSVPAAPARRDPLPELLLRAENEQRSLAAQGCREAATNLCYDLTSGRVVYRGARNYMPRVEGLTAESVSVRRDGIILRYSFK